MLDGRLAGRQASWSGKARQGHLPLCTCNGLFQQWFTKPQATFAAELVLSAPHLVCWRGEVGVEQQHVRVEQQRPEPSTGDVRPPRLRSTTCITGPLGDESVTSARTTSTGQRCRPSVTQIITAAALHGSSSTRLSYLT